MFQTTYCRRAATVCLFIDSSTSATAWKNITDSKNVLGVLYPGETTVETLTEALKGYF